MPVIPTRVALAVFLPTFLSALAACAPDERTAAPTTAAAPSQSVQCVTFTTFSRTTFIAADSNHDNVIDEAEFAADVAAAFAAVDQNMDYQLVPSELTGAPSGTFDRLDANHDGVLSFAEVMQEKLAEFQRADENKDGVLSIGEVLRFNAVQHGEC